MKTNRNKNIILIVLIILIFIIIPFLFFKYKDHFDNGKKLSEIEDNQENFEDQNFQNNSYDKNKTYNDKDLLSVLENENKLEKYIEQMSDEEKAGQLLIFAVKGTQLTNDYKNEIKLINPSGLIFMGDNIVSESQLSEFTKNLNSIIELPMFFAIDQEGGTVKRIKWDDTESQKMWKDMSDNEICDLSKKRANILKKSGLNLNFSPVIDLSNSSKSAFINNRTISQDPNIVAQKGKIYVNCSENQGVMTTLKHFPGHGATIADSHYTLPVINKPKKDWLKTDALPFKSINNLASFIMVGHLTFTDLDKKNSATQSKVIIQDILKKEFSYKGIIITDDMAQLHTSTKISIDVALKNAYTSGIDIVLYVANKESNVEIHKKLTMLIKNKSISEAEIDKSLKKILKLKANLI